MFDALDALDASVPEPEDVVAGPRSCGRRPEPPDDPLNAVVRWCDVRADVIDETAPLAGLRIGLKDNVAVSGVPMTCGSRLLETYVPQDDAIVVQRLLRAGARIVAKLNMDAFSWSGSGETSDFGPIRNPFDPDRTASGSSGGSGAALAYPAFDATIGTDQGGSIRLPAAWSGVIGLKPTHGLVPYTGCASMDPTYDHVGPLARTVETTARVLQAIAGPDHRDARQRDVVVGDYVGAVTGAPERLDGVRIGVLAEGMDLDPAADESADGIVAATQETVERLRALGADVHEVCVPEHRHIGGPMFATLAEGQAATAWAGGMAYGVHGRYSPDLNVALGRAMRMHGDELPPSMKLILLLGRYLNERYHGAVYARAQNATPRLRAAYDRALDAADALIMPTATQLPLRIAPEASLAERVLRGWGMVANTVPFDLTGHPALSLPAAELDGLPVGVMLVGRRFHEARLLAIARSYEATYGWAPTAAWR
jgi:amidase